jgi:hypothetical protein
VPLTLSFDLGFCPAISGDLPVLQMVAVAVVESSAAVAGGGVAKKKVAKLRAVVVNMFLLLLIVVVVDVVVVGTAVLAVVSFSSNCSCGQASNRRSDDGRVEQEVIVPERMTVVVCGDHDVHGVGRSSSADKKNTTGTPRMEDRMI